MIEKGLINTVIEKDLSRLSRNYILVGHYLKYYFPAKNVRFISINADYDSIKHSNIMERLDVPLKNMMYNHIAYETSEKVKESLYLIHNLQFFSAHIITNIKVNIVFYN